MDVKRTVVSISLFNFIKSRFVVNLFIVRMLVMPTVNGNITDHHAFLENSIQKV